MRPWQEQVDSFDLMYEILRRSPGIAGVAIMLLAFAWRGCLDSQELERTRERATLERTRERCEDRHGEWVETFDNAGRQSGYQCVIYEVP